MIALANPEIWFVCGSQHLYGPGPLKEVAANAEEVAKALAAVEDAAAQDDNEGARHDPRRDR